MSKLWLLLLALAALQAVHSFPAPEEEFIDDTDDEDRMNWKQFVIGIKQGWKIVKPKLKEAIQKGLKFIKESGVKVTPFECEGSSCNTCIIFMGGAQKACLKSTISRTKKRTFFTISGDLNGGKRFEEKIALGDLPRCALFGDVIGHICIKGVEGKAQAKDGKADLNFCLGFLAEKLNFGVKVCGTYENNKFNIKVHPEVFAGGLDDNGEIVIADEKDAEKGVTFDEVETA